MSRLALALLATLPLVAAAASPATPKLPRTVIDASRTLWVERGMYDDEWPFTVPEGWLECVPIGKGRRKEPGIIFHARGNAYAVNGTASGTGRWKPLDGIWAKAKNGLPVSPTPLINRGTIACGRLR